MTLFAFTKRKKKWNGTFKGIPPSLPPSHQNTTEYRDYTYTLVTVYLLNLIGFSLIIKEFSRPLSTSVEPQEEEEEKETEEKEEDEEQSSIDTNH